MNRLTENNFFKDGLSIVLDYYSRFVNNLDSKMIMFSAGCDTTGARCSQDGGEAYHHVR